MIHNIVKKYSGNKKSKIVDFSSGRLNLHILGPGLLFAATSVGTSHLVQSTRAGALYGLGLLGIILLCNAIKYPAFRFASDYFPATGTSVLEAYRRQGRGVLLLFTVITLATLLFAVSALALMSAGLMTVVFSLPLSAQTLALILIVATSMLLVIGHYRTLERITKILVVVMMLATLTATAFVLPDVDWSVGFSVFPVHMELSGYLFVAALIGWMPVPLDACVWQSLWAKAKADNAVTPPTVAQSRFDFNIGYSGTLLLAVCFLLMGAGLMHGKGVELASGATAFSAQLIQLYQRVFGELAGPLVGIAALAIIYSSLLAVMDAFPRTLSSLYRRWQGIAEQEDTHTLKETDPFYIGVLLLMFVGAILTYQFFLTSLTALVDIAATVAFVTAPIIAYLNHRAITADRVPLDYQPSAGLKAISIVCMCLLALFAMGYLYLRFWV